MKYNLRVRNDKKVENHCSNRRLQVLVNNLASCAMADFRIFSVKGELEKIIKNDFLPRSKSGSKI